jgi:hypothetical protein
MRSKRPPLNPVTDPTSIGNILVRLGYCSIEAVFAAVAIQAQRAPIGEILVEEGEITRDELETALLEQRVERGEATRKEQSDFRRRLASEIRDMGKASTEKLTVAVMAMERKSR